MRGEYALVPADLVLGGVAALIAVGRWKLRPVATAPTRRSLDAMTPAPRPLQQRKKDTLHRLEHDVDAWVATADLAGTPYLVPLSFLWDGQTLLISTAATNPTARNLRASGRVRLTIGPTRDVVLIEGTAVIVDEITDDIGDLFSAKTGFDPRTSNYPYFRIRPDPDPGLARGQRDRGPGPDGRWPVAGLALTGTATATVEAFLRQARARSSGYCFASRRSRPSSTAGRPGSGRSPEGLTARWAPRRPGEWRGG
ncbi:pyridoxamine 5'-phosphate oxidase family protein [Plantactinospora sp. B6F1]|uniref:pyridoxamine 5'-phosphate oxidase family protein n=1 Tax=Plantactinospora sp. B6F1 TaxID=3158971 RepID=UPI0032D8C67C